MPNQRSRLAKALLELGTIVGGILLAFAIDAWWDSSREREAAEQMLSGIEAELSQTLTVLDRDLEWLSASRRALAAWPTLPESGSEEVAGVLLLRTAEPELQRLRSALTSDRLTVLEPSIQDLVASVASYWDELAEEEEVYVRAQLGLVDYMRESERLDEFTRVCPDVGSDACHAFLSSLATDTGFREALAFKRMALAFYLEELPVLRGLMEDLRVVLRAGTS